MADVKFNIEVTMEERWVNDFCSMLKKIESNGNIGHSSTIAIYADGDGDFRPKFKIDIPFEQVQGIDKQDILWKPEVMFDAG